MREEIAVLDIGSGKIVFAVGQKSSDEIFNIKNFASLQYPGYYKGEWVDKESLATYIAEAVSKSGYNLKNKTLYVSVPAEFTFVKTNGLLTNLKKKKTIGEKMIKDIHNKADSFKVADYSVLCSSAIEYVLDGETHTITPIGESASSIYANMSYIFCKNDFIRTVCDISAKVGFKYVKFIDGVWAEGTQLIDEQARVNGAVLIDVGYASTTFAFVKGDGIKYKNSASFGYGFMVDALAGALNVNYYIAENMLGQITLNIDSDETSTYQYTVGNVQYECRARDINNLLHCLIADNLVDFVNSNIYRIKELDDMTNSRSGYSGKPVSSINYLTDFYLTGGGLSEIRGAVKYFERLLAKEVKMLKGNTAGWDKPYFASTFATLEVADKLNTKNSLLQKIFG